MFMLNPSYINYNINDIIAHPHIKHYAYNQPWMNTKIQMTIKITKINKEKWHKLI